MIYTNIKFPHEHLRVLGDVIQKAVNETGQDLRSAGEWAGRFVCDSLSASTRVAPKLRPIVKNPDQRYKRDARRAPFGMMAYRKGKQVFVPLRGTQFRHLFGKFASDVVIRYVDKRTSAYIEYDKGNKTWRKLPAGPDVANPEAVMPGIMTDKRRQIRRRKLAQLTWRRAKAKMRTGGEISEFNVPAGRVVVRGSATNPTLRIENNLRYAMDAFKTSGDKTVDSALLRARDRMFNRIQDKVAKRMGLV